MRLRFQPAKRTSQWVKEIRVLNFFRGIVRVTCNSTDIYIYENVSKRAIINLCLNPRMSYGFWVNNNCIKAARVKYYDIAEDFKDDWRMAS